MMEEVSLASPIVHGTPPLSAFSDALTGLLRFPPMLVEVVPARLAEGLEAGPARVFLVGDMIVVSFKNCKGVWVGARYLVGAGVVG
jgi:hypothetical protein